MAQYNATLDKLIKNLGTIEGPDGVKFGVEIRQYGNYQPKLRIIHPTNSRNNTSVSLSELRALIDAVEHCKAEEALHEAVSNYEKGKQQGKRGANAVTADMASLMTQMAQSLAALNTRLDAVEKK